MSAARLPQLPALLERAGCTLVAVGRQIVVLDRDGVELERAPHKQAEWLWSASSYALIERQAAQLGLHQELHLHELLVRLWWPGADPDAAAWVAFDQALADLAAIAAGEVIHQVAAPLPADDQAEAAPSDIPPVVIVEARIVRLVVVWKPRPQQRSGMRPAQRQRALWRWVVAEARRTPCSRRDDAGPARAPPEAQNDTHSHTSG